jgi:homoserine dehydrogenase
MSCVNYEHVFATVENEYNVPLWLFHGKGVGQLPAASTVTFDIISLSKSIVTNR